MKTQEIRDRYREFFTARGHEAWPSDSLVPKNDPTLMFSSAGMVQFKPYFRGEMGDVLKRATTCQKCFRTSDIENVGHTARHHTFFEMLGNFSFGDYFKKEAIRWAWEFSVDEIKLPVDKLWVSIYEKDEESAEIWKNEVGLTDNRIIRLGEKDNFWPASGILGPSGPCSEIYFDQGPAFGCGSPDCAPGCDCDRYLEYWNLVFTQFDRQPDGSLPPLGRKNIDTGMGLERLAAIIQGKPSNYDTDTLFPIIQHFEGLSGLKYHTDKVKDVSFRVLADHIRATIFVLTDHVTPSNTGRGYVLRRIMRRAIRHGLVLGIESNLMAPAMEVVAQVNRKEYPELVESLKFTQKIAHAEEEAFRSTINRGLNKLEEMISEIEGQGKKTLPGEKAFVLYDTFGFPSDLTKEILHERGFTGFDEDAFQTSMDEQRARAQAAWKGSGETKVDVGISLKATGFTGYESTIEESAVVAVFQGGKTAESALAGQTVDIVVEKTPFYADSGGQTGDKGWIENEDVYIRIETTRKSAAGVYVHSGEIERGIIRPGDKVRLTVDKAYREPTKKNHTATHLLHAALRSVLGTHVKQSGSLVNEENLRFDFTHYEAVKPEELKTIETMVNAWVYENHPVLIKSMSLDEAQKTGAMALFGEKYGDVVRTVTVLNEDPAGKPVSMELCGGTHIAATGEIGCFRIISESSISAGNRRIEGITGPKAIAYIQKEHELLRSIANELKVTPEEISVRIAKMADQTRQLERENRELKQKLLRGETSNLMDGAETIGDITILAKEMQGVEKEALQGAMDAILQGAKNRAALLTTVEEDKITLICGVTDDLTGKLDAGKMMKEISKIVGGGGGGRKDRAQAGGKDIAKIPDAIAKFKELVKSAVA